MLSVQKLQHTQATNLDMHLKDCIDLSSIDGAEMFHGKLKISHGGGPHSFSNGTAEYIAIT